MSKIRTVLFVFCLLLVATLSYQIIMQGVKEARGVVGSLKFSSSSILSGKTYAEISSISLAVNDPGGWVKIWDSGGGSVYTTDFRITGGYNNAQNNLEFRVTTSGYGQPHSIVMQPTTSYNTGTVSGIRTQNVSNTQLEVWILLDAVNPTQPGTVTVYATDTQLLNTLSIAATPTWGTKSVTVNPKFDMTNLALQLTSPLATSKVEAPTAAGIYLVDDANNGIFVQDGGNVGIGTAGPLTKLDVLNGTVNTVADSFGNVANFTGPTSTGQTSSVSINSNDAQAADKGGILGFGGRYIDAGTGYANWASIKGLKTNSTTGNYSGYLAFYTRLSGAGSVERMRILDTGNIGIGTTGAGYKLDVSGDIHATGWLRTDGTQGWYSQTYGGGWYMADTTWIRSYGSKSIYQDTGVLRTDGTLQVGASGATLNVPNGGNFAYRTNTLFANTSGNVGIGTAGPAYKLDVNGNGNFAGSVQSPNVINTGAPTYSIYDYSAGGGILVLYATPALVRVNGDANNGSCVTFFEGMSPGSPGQVVRIMNAPGPYCTGNSLTTILIHQAGSYVPNSTYWFTFQGGTNMTLTGDDYVDMVYQNSSWRPLGGYNKTFQGTVNAGAFGGGTISGSTGSFSGNVDIGTTNGATLNLGSQTAASMWFGRTYSYVQVGSATGISTNDERLRFVQKGPNIARMALVLGGTAPVGGSLIIGATLTQNGSPDVAELVTVRDQSISAGDIVSVSKVTHRGDTVYDNFLVEKGNNRDLKTVIGVISTDPGILINSDTHSEQAKEGEPMPRWSKSKRPLTIAGRTPIKVIASGVIGQGDLIGPSVYNGIGEKVLSSDFTVGKALESTKEWDRQRCLSVSSVEEIVWPEYVKSNPKEPCFVLPDGRYVGKILVTINPIQGQTDTSTIRSQKEQIGTMQSQIDELKKAVQSLQEKLGK